MVIQGQKSIFQFYCLLTEKLRFKRLSDTKKSVQIANRKN